LAIEVSSIGIEAEREDLHASGPAGAPTCASSIVQLYRPRVWDRGHERGTRQVLNDVAERLIQRHVLGRGATRVRAAKHLADLGQQVILGDEPVADGRLQFGALRQDRNAVVGEVSRTGDQVVVYLTRTEMAGAYDVQMGALRHI
jgi:hypothetical protein